MSTYSGAFVAKRTVAALAVVCAVAIPVLSAQTAKGPVFEVAAISPAAPLNPQQILASGGAGLRVGLNVTDTRVDAGYLSLADLLPLSFKVQPYQISGPSWLGEQRFDIHATIPPGATKEQVPEMMQALLVERFGLVSHRESREMPVYALAVDKEGSRLKDADPDVPKPPGEPGKDDLVFGQGDNQVRVSRGAGAGPGATAVTLTTGRAAMNMRMGDNGTIAMDISRMTIPELVQLLTPMVGRPVIDETRLTGTYKVTLEMAVTDLLSLARMSGIAGLPGTGVGASSAGALPAAGAADPGGSSIFEAIHKLGLKLEPKRSPVDVVVVDKVERTPTAN